MTLIRRVAAAAALLVTLSTAASAAIFPEDSLFGGSLAASNGHPQATALGLSALNDFTNRNINGITPSVMPTPAPQPSSFTSPTPLLFAPAPGTISVPTGLNLIQAKPRPTLPAYMIRDYRKTTPEAATSAR